MGQDSLSKAWRFHAKNLEGGTKPSAHVAAHVVAHASGLSAQSPYANLGESPGQIESGIDGAILLRALASGVHSLAPGFALGANATSPVNLATSPQESTTSCAESNVPGELAPTLVG